jgi:hypothetical protein
MPTPERGVSIDVIRAAAARAAAANGFRATARDVGMSVTGFRAFLDGGSPFASTRKKLTAWYVRRVALGEEEPTISVADAALAILVQHLPLDKREQVAEEIRSVVKRGTKAAKARLPDWME